MVDLTRDKHGKTRARLLDLVPGRSGKAYKDWLEERGFGFRNNVQVAALGPFAEYKTAIDDKPEDATAVLDAFHVVKLGTAAVDEVRRRVQQETLGHRGRKATRPTESTAASPAAPATAKTTDSECSWSPADSHHDPYRMSEEPV